VALRRYDRILVALDLSEAAEHVARTARGLVERYQGRLTLIHVVETAPPVDLAYDPVLTPDWGIDEEAMISQAGQRLAALARRADIQDAEQWVLAGSTKHEIERVAREQAFDLIVLGSHGRQGIARLLGSTANAVVHVAPCDVLAVRIQG